MGSWQYKDHAYFPQNVAYEVKAAREQLQKNTAIFLVEQKLNLSFSALKALY